MRVLPEKKPKSQDRPSASRPASRRPELVLLLLLSAQPGPSCLCRGCTRASTHTCRMIQLHGAPGAAGSLRMMLSPCGWRFFARVCCAVAQPCAAQRRLTLTGVNAFLARSHLIYLSLFKDYCLSSRLTWHDFVYVTMAPWIMWDHLATAVYCRPPFFHSFWALAPPSRRSPRHYPRRGLW